MENIEDEETYNLTRDELITKWRSVSKSYCDEVLKAAKYQTLSFKIYVTLVTIIAGLLIYIINN
jgi:hypothetical protein